MTGPQHTKLAVILTGVSLPVLLSAGVSLPDTLRVSAGIVLTIMVGADLDVDEGNISLDYMRRIFPPLAWFWRVTWWPYAKIFPHRGLSHIPVIGTFTRIGYILLIVWAIQALLYRPPFIPDRDYFMVFVGMAAGDFAHSLSDLISTAVKGNGGNK